MHDINKFGSREMESLMTTTGNKRNEFILEGCSDWNSIW